MTNVVNRFAGIYEFLSNFYPAPVTLDGVVYPTVENAFQGSKNRRYGAAQAVCTVLAWLRKEARPAGGLAVRLGSC